MYLPKFASALFRDGLKIVVIVNIAIFSYEGAIFFVLFAIIYDQDL